MSAESAQADNDFNPLLPPVSFDQEPPPDMEQHEQSTGGEDFHSDPTWLHNIREYADDPSWPPFPTMSNSQDSTKITSGKRVDLRPRLGKHEEASHEHHGRVPASPVPVMSSQVQPVVEHMLQFTCPGCFQWLQLSPMQSQNNVACHYCQAILAPPRLIQSVNVAPKPTPKSNSNSLPPPRTSPSDMFRPNRDRSVVRFVKSRDKPLPNKPENKPSNSSGKMDEY